MMANEKQSWFTVRAAATDGDLPEILIYDYIGSWGVNAKDFDKELKALGTPLKMRLRINSPGGETPTAASIYNMVARWKERTKAKVEVIIDGVALSSASWLAMLGDEVIMPENTLMMIHDPSGYASGTAKEMRALADVLDKVKKGMSVAYAKKSGKEPDDIDAIMAAETWYTAEEAVDEGFADRVEGSVDTVALTSDLESFSEHLDKMHLKNTPTALAGDARDRTVATTKEVPPMSENAPKNETPAEMEARLRTEILASLNKQDTAPVVAAAETPEQMEVRIRARLTEEGQIRAMCDEYGASDKAEAFIKDGKSLSQVMVALGPKPTQTRQGFVPSAHHNVLGGGHQQVEEKLEAPKLDPVAIWANWNKPKSRAAA